MTEQIDNIALNELEAVSNPAAKPLVERDYALVGDVKVKILAQLGEGEVSIDELFALKQGDVVPLTTHVDQALNLYVSDKLVARGHLVAVDDYYGIQISEILD